MAVNLKIPCISPVRRTFKLLTDTESMLQEYIEAAKAANPGAEEDQIVDAMLLNQMNKDTAFKRWRKERSKSEQET